MNTDNEGIIDRLSRKYRLVILRDSTLQEKLSFKVSRLNIYLLITLAGLLVALSTFLIIALTPLKEYIPGYQDVYTRKAVVGLSYRADSLETVLEQQNRFIWNIQQVLNGELDDSLLTDVEARVDSGLYDSLQLEEKSAADSLLRKQMEKEEYYALLENNDNELASSISELNFHTPVQGLLSGEFDPQNDHFGIDIVGKEKEPVKAVLPGVVIFQEWTLDTGYVLAIQHEYDLVSFYKHNSVNLKVIGNKVEGGDAIAIIGDSGHQSTGPHLHFELWHEQKAINPRDFLSF